MNTKTAFALAAHPDDIEFVMAGTLLHLKDAGYAIHYMNMTDGSCGSMVHPPEEIGPIRTEEGRAAAAIAGAVFHPGIVHDIEIFYEDGLLRRLGAIMRQVAPDILLLQSPEDYMEDHQNTVRLAVTAAFVRGVPNYHPEPPVAPVSNDVTVYHAQPHGNRDAMCRFIDPQIVVDIEPVLERKKAMLACHASQKDWLDKTQGMGSYLQTMEDLGREVGEKTGRFAIAEGWRRRSHLGFCSEGADPLSGALPGASFRVS
jgi:LmbE family N-acetylglucosaminyl deacetylase